MQMREVRKVWGVCDGRGLVLTVKGHDPEQDHEDLKAHRRELGHTIARFDEVWLSKRDMPLLLCAGTVPDCTLTAERYIKWYELYLIREGEVLIVDFSDLDPFTPKAESAYVDHAPNPRAIEAFAKANQYVVDPIFLEAAHGRWLLER